MLRRGMIVRWGMDSILSLKVERNTSTSFPFTKTFPWEDTRLDSQWFTRNQNGFGNDVCWRL